jgi:hypothetical protein
MANRIPAALSGGIETRSIPAFRLGDKLRLIEAGEARQQADRDAAAQAATVEAEQRRRESVRDLFENWKRDIERAVDRGVRPPPLRVAPVAKPNVRHALLISSPKCPDHDLYLDFQRWTTEQGMRILVGYADGHGGGDALLSLSSSA